MLNVFNMPVESLVAPIILGLSTALSPCTLPILFSIIPLTVKSRGRLGVLTCLLAVEGIVFVIGVALVLTGFILQLFTILKYIVGVLLVVLGLIVVLGRRVRVYFQYKPLGGRGVVTVCAGYAVFSSQCNLPLLAGVAFYIVSGVEVYDRLLRLTLYSLGVTIPVLLVLVLSSRVKEYLRIKLLSASRYLEFLSGFIFIIAGILLFTA